MRVSSTSEMKAPRRGQVLVEFALIALVLYLLLAGILEFGRALHVSGVIQQSADVMARELSRTPLPPAISFRDALDRPEVRRRVYDERLLVIDLDQNPDLDDLYSLFPVVNQMLRSAMIFEVVNGRRLIRYPGALVTAGQEPNVPLPPGFTDSGLRILIPRVGSRQATGEEVIAEWLPVVEEVGENSFTVAGTSPTSGTASVRINYPFQAATLSGYQPNPAGPFEPNLDNPIRADDDAVSAPPNNLAGGSEVGPYAGRYGLGKQEAWGQTIGPVRPFRKILAGQTAYRREIFGN